MKRNRSDTSCDTVPPDLPIEPLVAQSLVQDVSEPQFCYDSLDIWEYSAHDTAFANNIFPYFQVGEIGNDFGVNYVHAEESPIGNYGCDYTVNPECLWEPTT